MVLKNKQNEKNRRKLKGQNAIKNDNKTELEEIFFDAIQQTKQRISKRKGTNFDQFESAMSKLNDFDANKVKYEDFTNADK